MKTATRAWRSKQQLILNGVAMLIPIPKYNDKRARTRIVVITDNGFKANGVTAYTHDEFIELVESAGEWLIYKTVEFQEGGIKFAEETLCIQRSKIVAWAINEIGVPSGIEVVKSKVQI